MKKLLLPIMVILFTFSCKKEISINSLILEVESKKANDQIEVCHYDTETGTSLTINININAWPAHQAHGDLLGKCSEVIAIICGKEWMVKNLDVSTYRNGDPILQADDYYVWNDLPANTGKWCYYNNDPNNGSTYGKLYNWFAVNDPRGLAPVGWHIPTDQEWLELETCLGGYLVAGGKMKSTGTIEEGSGLWFSPNTEATNISGFTGLPGGYRDINYTFPEQWFHLIGRSGFWWRTSEDRNFVDRAHYSAIYHENSLLYFSDFIGAPKSNGASVRLIRDELISD